MIERPQHPYTQALVDGGPGADAPGAGASASCSAASCPTRPTCPAAAAFTRAARAASSPATGSIRRCVQAGAADQLAACLLHAPDASIDGGTSPGPVGHGEPGTRNAITDVPGVRVGHSQAESGEPTGVTVVAPPTLPAPAGDGGRQRRWASSPAASRSTSAARWTRRSTSAARTRVGTVHHAAVLASGRGPGRHRPAGRRRVRRLLARRLAAPSPPGRRRRGAGRARRRGWPRARSGPGPG